MLQKKEINAAHVAHCSQPQTRCSPGPAHGERRVAPRWGWGTHMSTSRSKRPHGVSGSQQGRHQNCPGITNRPPSGWPGWGGSRVWQVSPPPLQTDQMVQVPLWEPPTEHNPGQGPKSSPRPPRPPAGPPPPLAALPAGPAAPAPGAPTLQSLAWGSWAETWAVRPQGGRRPGPCPAERDPK